MLDPLGKSWFGGSEVMLYLMFRCFLETVVNRIVVGEVVEWPLVAVKELVENFVDVGVMHIDVVIEGGGQTLICVIDDGYGMSVEELILVVEWYVISKFFDDNFLYV